MSISTTEPEPPTLFPLFMPKSDLSSPVNLRGRALWFGEIELREDQISISGWSWTGPVEETISLDNVTKFYKWPPDRKGPNFRLSCESEVSLRGKMKGAELWARQFEDEDRVEVKRKSLP